MKRKLESWDSDCRAAVLQLFRLFLRPFAVDFRHWQEAEQSAEGRVAEAL